ncbi:MAG: sigma-54 dependent transcriptional regulator [Archangium sp.]
MVASRGALVGSSKCMRTLNERIDRAAEGDGSLLLQGESGSGKEVVARAVHQRSARARGPFVVVDCGALTPGLVASELFGHERGSFTGADARSLGAFERADGGTVMLDELGELPLAQQVALLGVLERRCFRRVGGTQDVPVDVRVISATHRPLRELVGSGAFRLDLFYRVAVLTLQVPSLRERPQDLEPLMRHFLSVLGVDDCAVLFQPETLERLCAHTWPGNVRELRNLVEFTVTMGELPHLEVDPADDRAVMLPGPQLPYGDARANLLLRFERSYLDRLLREVDGNVSAAARLAKMNRTHLIDLLQRHGLSPRRAPVLRLASEAH